MPNGTEVETEAKPAASPPVDRGKQSRAVVGYLTLKVLVAGGAMPTLDQIAVTLGVSPDVPGKVIAKTHSLRQDVIAKLAAKEGKSPEEFCARALQVSSDVARLCKKLAL